MSDASNNPETSGEPAQPTVGHGAIHIRGGPHKVSGIQQSANEAQEKREQFEKEQGGSQAAEEKPHPQMHPAIARMRGGPEKIKAISESAKKAQESRDQYAKEQAAAGIVEGEDKC